MPLFCCCVMMCQTVYVLLPPINLSTDELVSMFCLARLPVVLFISLVHSFSVLLSQPPHFVCVLACLSISILYVLKNVVCC